MQVPPTAYQFKAAGRAALAGQPTQLSAEARAMVGRHLSALLAAAVAAVRTHPTTTAMEALAVHRETLRAERQEPTPGPLTGRLEQMPSAHALDQVLAVARRTTLLLETEVLAAHRVAAVEEAVRARMTIRRAMAAPVPVAKSGYLNLKKRPVSLARWAEAG
jgi:hypothetical protein